MGAASYLTWLQLARAPLAAEAVRRTDAIFDAERTIGPERSGRDINGLPPERRLAARRGHVAPLVAALEAWMRAERARLSRHNEVSRAMDYMLRRWTAFTPWRRARHVR